MTITREQSQLIAIRGLQYLAGDEEQLNRFFALSGCDPELLRENAQSPEFLAGVLEFFMGNEPTLLAFCAQNSIDPQSIAHAQSCLDGNNQTHEGDF